MQVALIRHGQIPGNVERRYVGTTDESLTEIGRQQASSLAAPEANKVFASPYKRCIETAKLVYPPLEPTIVDGLKEMDFGLFENKSADEMVNFKPYRDWVDGMCMGKIPEGESREEFDERVCAAFVRIVEKCRHSDKIALVVHGGTIMSIMGAFNDEGKSYFEYHVGNCGTIVCNLDRAGTSAGDGHRRGYVLHRIDGGSTKGTLPPK